MTVKRAQIPRGKETITPLAERTAARNGFVSVGYHYARIAKQLLS